MATAQRPLVVLVHGIWMPRLSLLYWQRALHRAGFDTRLFPYSSLRQPVATAVLALRELLCREAQRPVHLVGHSLGGLLSLLAANRIGLEGVPVAESEHSLGQRIVCMGSPLRGSHVARVLARQPWSRPLLGTARELLCEGPSRWQGSTPVLSIAGDLPTGFGALIPGLARPHDGTVAVSETCVDGLAGQLTVRASHSGLLASARAMAASIAFFQDVPGPAAASSGSAPFR